MCAGVILTAGVVGATIAATGSCANPRVTQTGRAEEVPGEQGELVDVVTTGLLQRLEQRGLEPAALLVKGNAQATDVEHASLRAG